MNRAFVSLYLIIVLSILLLGVVLNKFWDEFNPPQAVDPAVVDLMALLEQSLASEQHQHPDQPKQTALNHLSAGQQFKADIVPLTSFSKTVLAENIARGEIVSASDEHTNYFYKRMANSDDVLSLAYAFEFNKHSEFYLVFILVFYGAIAGVVFLWVWPLARDLARLTQHAQQMGRETQRKTIAISPRSVVYPFAKVFNAMATRLDDILRSQKEMTLAVSHELRTPLARMKFALAMTEEQNLAPGFARQLSSINRDISEMESLINSFLAYAAFEQQSQQLNQGEGHMQDMVQEIIGRLTGHISRSVGVEVVDKTDGAAMRCEWSLMQTAIQNLLHNALGYAKSQIRITLAKEEEGFIVVVEDDGPGIPEEQRKRVFESFVRLYSDLPNRSGFGLGLALVSRIMDWHLGSASCSCSTLGGAKFILKWPC